jgi:hypothetical protein
VCDGSVFSAAVRPKTATRQSRADCRGAAIYVTDEKIQNFSGNHVGTARDGLEGGFRVGLTGAGVRHDHFGEPDHVPTLVRLCGRGQWPGSESKHIRFELESSKSVVVMMTYSRVLNHSAKQLSLSCSG